MSKAVVFAVSFASLFVVFGLLLLAVSIEAQTCLMSTGLTNLLAELGKVVGAPINYVLPPIK